MPYGWSGGTRKGFTPKQIAAILTRDPLCQIQSDGCTRASTEADHRIPLAWGGTNTLDNGRGACHHCHTTETKRQAAAGIKRAASKARYPTRPSPGLVTRPEA